MTIRTFADRITAAIFTGVRVRAFSVEVQTAARRKLIQINAAHTLVDLASPPGNRLELLKGDRSGYYSIRVNLQFRIIFQFADGIADEVELVDYH